MTNVVYISLKEKGIITWKWVMVSQHFSRVHAVFRPQFKKASVETLVRSAQLTTTFPPSLTEPSCGCCSPWCHYIGVSELITGSTPATSSPVRRCSWEPVSVTSFTATLTVTRADVQLKWPNQSCAATRCKVNLLHLWVVPFLMWISWGSPSFRSIDQEFKW